MTEKKKRTPSRATLLTRAHGRLYRAEQAFSDLQAAKRRYDARFTERLAKVDQEIKEAQDALNALSPFGDKEPK